MRAASFVLVIALAISLSCNVNKYCLNCATDDGGVGDGSLDGLSDADGNQSDGGPCTPTGTEICDDQDNDCDGATDEGQLPEVDEPCSEQRGECAGAVKQCTNGAIRCSKQPVAEKCNLLDDDCDGVVDNGDPSDALHASGAKCGTDAGECVAGRFHCNVTTGVVTCGLACGTAQAFDCPVGGEVAPFGTGTDTVCNARDDDCDGDFDEEVPGGPACGGGTVNGGTSVCARGTFQCVGGATVCVGSTSPEPFERCDNLDNDCNGNVDETFDLATDPLNCGACGAACNLAHAFEGCADPDGAGAAPSACTIFVCETGFHDNDALETTGCEFGPCTITSTIEVCNGVDDDCNPNTSEASLTAPPNFCLSQGACQGAGAMCQGTNGFVCAYDPAVSVDANGNIVPETSCDGIDNDCDGQIDENQPNVGDGCLEAGKQGSCQGRGEFRCDSANPNGPAVCVITTPGASPTTEICNGLDDDCDGVLDNNAVDDMVAVTNGAGTVVFRIDAFEASRPDASLTKIGTMSHRACSRPQVIPWSSITEPQAAQACAAAGKRLCTSTEWQAACQGLALRTYPYGNTYQSDACNGNDYDHDCSAPDDDRALPTKTAMGCPTKPAQSACVSSFGAFDLSGNLKEWTSSQTQGAFQVRGGGFDTAAGGLTCQFDFVAMEAGFSFPNLGFRCCLDP